MAGTGNPYTSCFAEQIFHERQVKQTPKIQKCPCYLPCYQGFRDRRPDAHRRGSEAISGLILRRPRRGGADDTECFRKRGRLEGWKQALRLPIHDGDARSVLVAVLRDAPGVSLASTEARAGTLLRTRADVVAGAGRGPKTKKFPVTFHVLREFRHHPGLRRTDRLVASGDRIYMERETRFRRRPSADAQ
jgi:hypothetical protein